MPRDLRAYARGKECKIRIPGYAHMPETVVLCHLRMHDLCGGGQKPHDIFGAWGCYDCHRLVDSRDLTKEERNLDRDWIRECFFEGVLRTQQALLNDEIILVVL